MDAQPARITFVITGLYYGGAQNQLVQIAVRLKAQGRAVQVVAMRGVQPFYRDALAAAGIPVETLDMRRGLPDPRALWRLCGILRRWRPQLVNSYMFHANLLTRVARLFCPVPVLISSVRSIYEGGRWREYALRLTDGLADFTTQNSRAGAERYVQVGAVPAHKMRFIPNGIDIAAYRPDLAARQRLRAAFGLGDDCFLWLAVGRLVTIKDYPSLLQAFVRLGETRARLFIAGDGRLHDAVHAAIESLGLAGRVQLLGIRRDIPALMNAADGYVLSSLWEGMPNVLMEAAATGLPIVSTEVGGVAEVVPDAGGVLVPPRDPEALAGAMRQVMALSGVGRREMGDAGRAHIEARYSFPRVVEQWAALYREAFNAAGGIS